MGVVVVDVVVVGVVVVSVVADWNAQLAITGPIKSSKNIFFGDTWSSSVGCKFEGILRRFYVRFIAGGRFW